MNFTQESAASVQLPVDLLPGYSSVNVGGAAVFMFLVNMFGDPLQSACLAFFFFLTC